MVSHERLRTYEGIRQVVGRQKQAIRWALEMAGKL
jgi:hypothetical protein